MLTLKNNVPIAFSIIMQIKNIQINIDKILKQKFLEHNLEEILINMLNSGVMDLAALMNNHIYLKDLTPYKVFQERSKQNINSYYNFFQYSKDIQEYCYENNFWGEEQLNRLELK